MRPRIKCISFDLWLTLIASHPESGKARARILARAFGVEPTEKFLGLVREVSLELDRRAEDTGSDFDCGDRIDLLCRRLNRAPFSAAERALLVRQCQSSIRRNRPTLINPDTIAHLQSLRDQGYKLALISNTGYPEAPVMREIVDGLGIGPLFDVMVFSSEVGAAKPSPTIFQVVCDTLKIEPSELLHVGDSKKADYHGARAFGARSLHFAPGEEVIEHERIRSVGEVARYAASLEPVARFPLFELTVQRGRVVDQTGKPFSVNDYSQFKHGDAKVQREYGYLLAELFIERFGAELARDPGQFVIAPFAFMHVPTAAGNMMEWFHERLGAHLRTLGKPCVERFHIYKHVTKHSQDHAYATVSDAERRRILDETMLSVDKARLAGKTVVLIDDIFITGNSERKIHETVCGSGAREIVFLYVARMETSIAVADPGVESRLNQWLIKDIGDLRRIFVPGGYRMNLRNCKFILEASPTEVARFVRSLDSTVVRDLYSTCLDNSYYLEPRYDGTFACIEAEHLRRGGQVWPLEKRTPQAIAQSAQ